MTGITASRTHAGTIVGELMGVRVAKDLVFDLEHIIKISSVLRYPKYTL